MIRTILTHALVAGALLTGTAFAETDETVEETSRSLAYCGSQVATLAWFYQGVVNDGSPEVQPELDGLLAMQSIFITQVEKDGADTIDLFKAMTKASVNDLVEGMQGDEEQAALALSHVNTNVRGCADVYFEKIEDEDKSAE